MTKEKEALRMALEALEREARDYAVHDELHIPRSMRNAITAINEALALPEQEPVACQHKRYSIDVHEQVGNCLDCGAEGRMRFIVGTPQRKPLTDEEIKRIWGSYFSRGMEFARAIEAAHGIKE